MGKEQLLRAENKAGEGGDGLEGSTERERLLVSSDMNDWPS